MQQKSKILPLQTKNPAPGGLPVREKNTAKPEKDLTVFLLTTPDGRTALRRRPETGLLSGLWEFPNTAGELTETLAAQQLRDWGLTPLS